MLPPRDISINEQQRLQKLYPLFDFKFDDNGCMVYFNKEHSSALSLWGKYGRLENSAEIELSHKHLEVSINNQLMKQYIDLFISCYFGRDKISVSLWVKRNGKDGEAINFIGLDNNIISPTFYKEMARIDYMACRAKYPGLFFCTGHGEPDMKENYGFFHFAGKYCKQYGIEHPDKLKEAQNETYN